MNIQSVVDSQRKFFKTGATLPVAFRLNALKRLKQAILTYQDDITQALAADLGKSRFESYMSEIGMVLSEIGYMQKHLKTFAKQQRVPTPLTHFPAATFRCPSPYGTVLVMSPWNYPFLLTFGPVVDALSAGNTVVVKPGAYAPATAEVVEKIFASCLPPELVSVVRGGRDVNAELLDVRFDYIFFTGGQNVGQLVLQKAAKHLTPVTLELGGKSPCIVDETADVELAAKRIVFGKFLNAGQTCVAPDYVLVYSSVKKAFLDSLAVEIKAQFGENPLTNPDYGKIVNEKHFARLLKLFKKETIFYGGRYDEAALKIEPTVLTDVTPRAPCMQEEIFGPVLPVLEISSPEDAENVIRQNPTPLALYLFSTDKTRQRDVVEKIQFGGGCINDTIIHLANPETGFGGVGTSGMGAYHGKTGFDTFTHYKSIVDKKNWLDLPIRYQPYDAWKLKLLRLFLR